MNTGPNVLCLSRHKYYLVLSSYIEQFIFWQVFSVVCPWNCTQSCTCTWVMLAGRHSFKKSLILNVQKLTGLQMFLAEGNASICF